MYYDGVGFVASAFDLLHPGHLNLLRTMNEMCDSVTVGLHVNPQLERSEKNKPIQSVYERWIQLEACKYVDKIIPYETENDLYNLLTTEQIDVRFLGSEYQTKIFTGSVLDMQIHYVPRNHTFSSSNLRIRMGDI
jgi:glycerol-3-phosphate cytidylyltransferase